MFEDPAGNEYRLEVDHVVQPPMPGYRTGGGVLTNTVHHGNTDTGSPLMPEAYTYGAFWALSDLYVNGELAQELMLAHFMTTETVRDADYEIVFDDGLPLPQEDTPTGAIHHTHGVVFPIQGTPQGPVFQPVNTSFELTNGQTQPFIHAMWEEETISEGPHAQWTPDEGLAAMGGGE